MTSEQIKRQPKLNENYMCFLHYISSFEKYVLLNASSFASFCFALAFSPLIAGDVVLIWKPVK